MPQILARKVAKQGALAASLATMLVTLGATPGACNWLDSLDPSSWFAEKYKAEVQPTIPAEKLYSEGLTNLEDRNFEIASKKFDDLDKRYANTDWSRRALLMTAYANYEGQKYDDAINASKRYLQRHPATKDAAYAQYLMAMSQYKQIPDVTRDQERSEKALMAFQELVQRYPTSEYASDAKSKISITRDQLAGKEMEVGRFYLEKRNFPAAINRFRDVVSKYQTTRHAEEALERLTEAYMALGLTSEAQTSAAVLGHNYPDSQWYKDAFALLQNGGLEPREESSSWLSKVYRGVKGVAVASVSPPEVRRAPEVRSAPEAGGKAEGKGTPRAAKAVPAKVPPAPKAAPAKEAPDTKEVPDTLGHPSLKGMAADAE